MFLKCTKVGKTSEITCKANYSGRTTSILQKWYKVHSYQCKVHTCTVHSTQYTVHSTQYTVHSTQYTVHCTQYTVHSS